MQKEVSRCTICGRRRRILSCGLAGYSRVMLTGCGGVILICCCRTTFFILIALRVVVVILITRNLVIRIGLTILGIIGETFILGPGCAIHTGWDQLRGGGSGGMIRGGDRGGSGAICHARAETGHGGEDGGGGGLVFHAGWDQLRGGDSSSKTGRRSIR